MAAAKGDDVDIFAVYAEPPLVAVNLFHLRNGQIVDRREFFWEDQYEFDEPEFFSVAAEADLSRPAVHPRRSFTCRWTSKIARRWRSCSSEKRNRKVEIHTPQRGQKKALLDLVRDQRQAQLRRAFPRAEAVVASHSGSRCRTR